MISFSPMGLGIIPVINYDCPENGLPIFSSQKFSWKKSGAKKAYKTVGLMGYRYCIHLGSLGIANNRPTTRQAVFAWVFYPQAAVTN